MTIGEAARQTNLPESTLRYYEKKGLIRVARDDNGRRSYEAGDVEWVKFIRRLKETGMALRNISRYSELRYAGESTMPERRQMLLKHREYIIKEQRKWSEYLENIDAKIDFYQQAIAKLE